MGDRPRRKMPGDAISRVRRSATKCHVSFRFAVLVGNKLEPIKPGEVPKKPENGVKKINGLMKAMVENISNANGQKYTNHSNMKTLITTLLGNNIERSDIQVNLAVIAMSRVSTAMPLHPNKHSSECPPS